MTAPGGAVEKTRGVVHDVRVYFPVGGVSGPMGPVIRVVGQTADGTGWLADACLTARETRELGPRLRGTADCGTPDTVRIPARPARAPCLYSHPFPSEPAGFQAGLLASRCAAFTVAALTWGSRPPGGYLNSGGDADSVESNVDAERAGAYGGHRELEAGVTDVDRRCLVCGCAHSGHHLPIV